MPVRWFRKAVDAPQHAFAARFNQPIVHTARDAQYLSLARDKLRSKEP
jgi:hypothetical protein